MRPACSPLSSKPHEDFRELVPEFAVTVNGSDLPPEAQEALDRIRVEESVDAAGMFAPQFQAS